MAAVYQSEIEASHDCSDCARSPELWRSKGCCINDLGGAESLPITWDDAHGALVTGHEAYPVEWTTCPRALLRNDLNPDGLGVATIVAQAAYAEVKTRWPDVPARLWGLVCLYERAEQAKWTAKQNAQMRAI